MLRLFIGWINKSERKMSLKPIAKRKTDFIEKEEELVLLLAVP